MIDLETIKKRLSEATPGPWRWREDLIRTKYMTRIRNGAWRAKSGRSACRTYVFFLSGPVRGDHQEGDVEELFSKGIIDEYDFPRVLALRWDQVRGRELCNAGLLSPDMAFIEHAPADVAALVAEVEALRAEVARLRRIIAQPA